jgi:hypothetical protein
MEYVLDAAGILADALLVWWIVAGHHPKTFVQERKSATDASRS